MPLDTSNQFNVVRDGEEVAFTPFAGTGQCRLSKHQALVLAAWLVAVADDSPKFDFILTEILK